MPAERPARRAPGAGAPLEHLPLLLLTASVVLLALGLWATAVTAHRATTAAVARELAFALIWLVVGAIAVRLGRRPIAVRILTLALVLCATFAGSFGLLSHAPYARVIATVAVVLIPFQGPIAAHLVLSYPTGRLDDRTARSIAAAAYALAAVESLLFSLQDAPATCPRCATSYTYVGLPKAFGSIASTTIGLLWCLVAIAVLWQLVRQYRRAGRRQQRLLRLTYVAMVAAVALYGVVAVLAGLRGRGIWGMSAQMLVTLQVVSLIAVPCSMLVGLLRERLAHKQISDFVVASVSDPDADLESALGHALDDPGLMITFPVAGGFVDQRGGPRPAPAPGATTEVTVVGPSHSPLALVSHDRSLAAEPALLTAAGSATRLLLENARLQAEVRAQLLEVRGSRSRILEAADDARVRLERDLHDGAQQRLLAIGIALDLLQERPGDLEVLANAKEEVSGALAELRALAAGIHPAVLTDLGLLPALDALARRIGPLVTVEALDGDPGRRRAAVEAAAYFTAAEAVTNAVKHAEAARVRVVVACRPDRLVVTVEDDGRGGADPTGRGLVGVRDRLAGVDGTLIVESPAGAGTRLTISIPEPADAARCG